LQRVALFVNCTLNIPMYIMSLCLTLYVGIVYGLHNRVAATESHQEVATATEATATSSDYYLFLLVQSAYYAALLYIPYILIVDRQSVGRRGLGFSSSSHSSSSSIRPLTHQLRNLPMYRWVAQYFPVTLHTTTAAEQPLDGAGRYLFLYHPHGVIGMGANAALNTEGCRFSDRVHSGRRYGVTLTASFLCPFLREWLVELGYIHADRSTLLQVLSDKDNPSSVVLVPGGAKEALYATPGRFRLVRRLGFVRLALDTGAIPVPILGFGENNAFSTIAFEPGTIGFQIQHRVSEFLSFSIPILTSPFCVRHPIDVVVGEPVVFPPGASVHECQAQYMSAVDALYDAHKDKYGHGNIPLEWI
jgi:Diacylglycerol acyltransferase